MIFQRAVRREFAQTAAGIFTALFAIMLTTQLVRLLNEAVQGKVEADAVAALLGFAALNYLPHLLSLSLFVAILLSLSRAYRDSEMVVWFSCGLPLTAWIRPVIDFAAPLVATIAALAFFLSPWAVSESIEFRNKLSTRRDAGQVAPGTFQESSTGNRVVFVEEVADDTSHVRNVFVSDTRPDRLGITTAGTGYQEIAANGDRFIVLQEGRRYEFAPGSAEISQIEFARYAVRLETKEARGVVQTPRSMGTVELAANDSRQHRSELLGRLSLPISALILALLSIPLSFVNPRAGRSANMLLAILAYLFYNNLVTIGQEWVARGKLSFSVALLGIHLLMLCLLPVLFYRRIAVSSFLRLAR